MSAATLGAEAHDRRQIRRLALLLGTPLLIAARAGAQVVPPPLPEGVHPFIIVPLHNGRNSVDLLGNGDSAVVDVADRENFNAHGHHVAVFQVRARVDPGDTTAAVAWQVVPFFGGSVDSVTGEEIFRTVEGADCNLRDLRILRTAPNRPATVVIAERELGASFAAAAPVQFRFFQLRVNSRGSVGHPTYYFEQTSVVRANHFYCDVDDAFDREHGFGRAGILVWDGPR